MRDRMIGVVMLCGIVVSYVGAGQETEASQAVEVTVDQVLERYIRACGGKEALEKVTSRVSRGTVEIPAAGLRGTFESYAQAPNRVRVVVELPGFGAIHEGFDGAIAWVKDPITGIREKSGRELWATRLDADFYKPLRLKELYPKIEMKGKGAVGESEVYVLEATPAEGSAERWYFNISTGLLVRMDVEREGPQGKIPMEIYFEDYRDIDGLRLPFTVRQVTPILSLIFRTEEVKHNVPIESGKFAKPTS
jgi:zinc protease